MSLQHGNIVQVLDLGVAAGRYFLALELVDGWDLEKILHRAYAADVVWPPALSLYVVAEVCRALAYAHAKTRDGKALGIVHRDISPNNVLVSSEGEVKLADFGIAKAQRKREQTAAGVIKGKVAYMSPEQASGTAIDHRSDIFSVGSMLYRMMTNRLPFEAANDLEALLRVQKAELTTPVEGRPEVSPSVAAIIAKAMRLPPGERYQTAAEMLSDVERVLRTEFQSAGQTELKLWLEQLGRSDSAPSIGRLPANPSGVVQAVMATDLSVGTSFELRDLEQASEPTELARSRSPAPVVKPADKPESRSGSTAEIVKPSGAKAPGQRASGFWPGVFLTLSVVVGIRYGIGWAQKRGMLTALGLGDTAAPPVPPSTIGPAPSSISAPARHEEGAPIAKREAVLATAPRPAVAKEAAPSPVAPVAAAASSAEAPDAHPAVVAAAGKPEAPKPEVPKEADDEPDEEALLRSAMPNAENAVIGEDDAETAPPGKSAAAAKPRATGKPEPAGVPHVETAILHFTSAPSGAVVKTKARVLGRTPINLHFKAGNTYEIVLVKSGFEPVTRTVAVRGTKDRKIAVTLKKIPPRSAAKRPSFFHPHR
jgi:serine/threonine-protein kinase